MALDFVIGYGEGGYGSSTYGGIVDRNLPFAVREWDSVATIEDGSNNRSLVRSLLESTDNIDESLARIYSDHHINTSTGEALDRIGDFVGVPRQTNETDTRYRTRIKANFRAGTIEPTTDNFTEFVITLLQVS